MKYSWHVKWRRYCPISWLLCWLFEYNPNLLRLGLYELHDFFCPEEQEFKEEFSREELKEELNRINKENFIPLDEI